MATTRKPPQIVIALLALFCLAMVATTATAKDIEWKNKKLEFVDYNGKKCLRAEGYYFNSSGGRVITGINTISFTWQESRNGETRDGSVSFEDPPFHETRLRPGETLLFAGPRLLSVRDAQGNAYGEHALRAFLASNDKPPQALASALFKNLCAHADGQPQEDLTFFALRWTGKSGGGYSACSGASAASGCGGRL